MNNFTKIEIDDTLCWSQVLDNRILRVPVDHGSEISMKDFMLRKQDISEYVLFIIGIDQCFGIGEY
jgi:hypothetical protein